MVGSRTRIIWLIALLASGFAAAVVIIEMMKPFLSRLVDDLQKAERVEDLSSEVQLVLLLAVILFPILFLIVTKITNFYVGLLRERLSPPTYRLICLIPFAFLPIIAFVIALSLAFK